MFESFIGVNFWTALFVLLNTLAIYFVAKHFLFVPVKEMIDARQKEIDDMYDAAALAQADAKALQSDYQLKLSAAAETSDRLVKEAMVRAQKREEEIILQANQQASAILEKASADIAQEKKKAINDAKNEISDMALAIAGKVVGRELKDADQNQLIDRFIDELGEQL